MTKYPIIPPEFKAAAEQLKLSPAIVSGNHVFLTGVTGADSDGQMPDDPEAQIRNIFEKIDLVLRHAGLTFGAIVEMTSYHFGMGNHFDLFADIRRICTAPLSGVDRRRGRRLTTERRYC